MKKRIRLVGCIIRVNDRILLLYRSARETDPSLWGIPAGKVEPGETDIQAIVREVQEETSIVLDDQSIEYFGILPIEYDTFIVDFPIFVANFDYQPEVKLSLREHIAYKWIKPHQALAIGDLMKDVDVIIEEFCIEKLKMI